MKKQIMKPDNKRWDDFCQKLEGKGACNFKEKIKGDPKSITWKCSGKPDRPFAIKILEQMGNINIRKTLKYFDKHGGHCDCEILFNIDR